MNDILRRVLYILKAQAITMPQRLLLWAIQDLAKQEPPASLDPSDARYLTAYYRAVLIAGIEGVEVVWNMTNLDRQDTLDLLVFGEKIERYAQAEVQSALGFHYDRDHWENQQ